MIRHRSARLGLATFMISVIIPVYNRPQSAVRAARSALAQELEGGDTLEVILIDDGSEPALKLDQKALENDSGSSRARIVRLQRNGGPAVARNRGIEESSGDYIAFLDSDDVWLPGKLAAQLAIVRKVDALSPSDGGVNLAMRGVISGFYYPNRRIGRLEGRLPMAGQDVAQFASGCWSAPGTVLLVHRDAFRRVGLLDPNLRRLEDYDWLLRFGVAGGRLDVADHMGAVIAPSGLARSEIVSRTIAQLIAKYRDGGEYSLSPTARQRFDAYLELERAAAEMADGQWARGIVSMLRSQVLKPRTTAALLPFWTRSDVVPAHVMTRYQDLLNPAS